MKYMGSKRSLLSGELGRILTRASSKSDRFVDLFAGTAAVAHYVAERVHTPVIAVDLQRYSAILAASVISRTEPLDPQICAATWLKPAEEAVASDSQLEQLLRASTPLDVPSASAARSVSAASPHRLVRHYGGHYFSPHQALVLHHMLETLPGDREMRTLAHAAILEAASKCAAAPGHTAQPFTPSERLLPFIREAWARDPIEVARSAVMGLSLRSAKTAGEAHVMGAMDFADGMLRDGDLVFCDPPYSDVQYSRFYHVIEGLALGGWAAVEGVGRAPARSLRARSEFSLRRTAATALNELLERISDSGGQVVMTFPAGETSNGLSGRRAVDLVGRYFHCSVLVVPHVHSTLGGAKTVDGALVRGSRRRLEELVIVGSRRGGRA